MTCARCLCLLVTLAFAADHAELVGRVVGVHDGDTLTLLVDRQQYKVRLDGIDAPELGQDYGTRAKQALSKAVFGKTLRIETHGQDKYGRTLGEVFDGAESINRRLVRDGMAWHYAKYSTSKELADAEKTARQNKTGPWADPAAVPPWEYRAKKKAPPAATGEHWLNTSSNVRHNSTCKHFKATKRGRLCGPDDGKPCGICGG